jgi:hypothetical protein
VQHSNQTEIIITGILPSIEIWTDISDCFDMVRQIGSVPCLL